MTALARVTRVINVGGILVVAGLLVAWQVVVVARVLDLDYLPAPTAIWAAGWDVLVSGELLDDVGHTLGTTLLATAIATVVGAASGLAIGLIETVRTYSTSSVDFLRTIPVTALVPAALLVWGPSSTAEVAVAAYAAVWPILVNTSGGVRDIPPRLYDVAKVLRMSRTAWVRRIVVPAATQSILVGVRLGIVTALVLAIVAEMLINPQGLGWGIVQARNALQPERLWAYTLTVGVLAYLLNFSLVWGVRRLLPGSSDHLEAVSS